MQCAHSSKNIVKCASEIDILKKCALKTHELAVHQKLRPFRCNYCGASFSEKQNMKRLKSLIPTYVQVLRAVLMHTLEAGHRTDTVATGRQFEKSDKFEKSEKLDSDIC